MTNPSTPKISDREKLATIARILYRQGPWIELPWGVRQILTVVLEEIGELQRGTWKPDPPPTPRPKPKRKPDAPWD